MVVYRALARAPAVLAALFLVAPLTSYAQSSSTAPISQNWSGYVASDAYYTGVSALIQTPVASDDPKVRSASVSSWVGIGGTDSSDLIQAGVDVDTSLPETSYHAWYETLPEASQTTSLEVHGGDWVQVDIEEGDSNQWQIKIVDGQQVFQIVVPYTSSHSSAEWIVEDPSAAQGLVPLASVNGANFSKMAAIANGASAVPAQLSAKRIAMVSQGHPEAVPSPLGPDGDSFSVAATT